MTNLKKTSKSQNISIFQFEVLKEFLFIVIILNILINKRYVNGGWLKIVIKILRHSECRLPRRQP